MQCFREFPVAKKFMDKWGRGVSRFSVEIFFVSQCRKTLWIKGGGGGEGVSRCSVEIFLSHSAENFRRGESFSVSLNSGIEKVWIRGGSIKIFCRIFLSHSTKNIQRGTL